MFFLICFLVGIIFPFVFFKAKSKKLKWVPGIIFALAAFTAGIKMKFFPGPDMGGLADVIFFMIFGVMTIGSIVSAGILHFLKK